MIPMTLFTIHLQSMNNRPFTHFSTIINVNWSSIQLIQKKFPTTKHPLIYQLKLFLKLDVFCIVTPFIYNRFFPERFLLYSETKENMLDLNTTLQVHLKNLQEYAKRSRNIGFVLSGVGHIHVNVYI